nr:hypothetical protein [Bacteroidota bacterium]
MKKLLLLSIIILPVFALSQRLTINLSGNSIDLADNDSLTCSFYLPNPTLTTIKYINVFGGEEILIEKEKSRNRGWQVIVLKSDSLRNTNHPSGIYYFEVTGRSDGKQNIDYNSFRSPWGESVEATDVVFDPNTGEISYQLPKTCFVKLRIGFNNGSLVRTLINLEPQKTGINMATWDGLDQSGKIKIGSDLNPKPQIISYAIPGTSFYLINPEKPVDFTAKATYPENWNKYALAPFAKIPWTTNLDVALQYSVTPNQDTTLSFDFPIQTEEFNSVFADENEIYISVDNEYIVENPNVLVPGNYSIAFPGLLQGKHTVIVNIILPENRIATGISEFTIY